MTVVLSLVAAATGLLCCRLIIIMKIKALIIVVIFVGIGIISGSIRNSSIIIISGDIPLKA